MRVGVFFSYFDPTAGGGHTFQQEILRALLYMSSTCNHELTLYFEANSETKDASLPLPSASNVSSKWLIRPVTPPVVPKSPWTRVMDKLRLRERAIPSSPFLQEAVHEDNIQLVWFASGLYTPVEVPYIATVWDIQHRIQPWFPEVSQNGQWQGRENYYADYLRRASFILTPNQTGQNEIACSYQIPAERFRRLPHPVPHIEFLPEKDEVQSVLNKYGLHNQYLFYPAQFWSHKNHANLLRALKLLHETYKIDLHLVLAGSDAGNMEYVRSMAEAFHVADKVHFLGFIPRQDLLALYRGAFALSYVTYFGPENLPPLEAFACGCPVVASKVAGAQEQFGDAALLVDPSNPDEIALAIKQIYDDPSLRASLITKGQKRSKEYTGTDYVRDVFKIMDEFEFIRINWQ